MLARECDPVSLPNAATSIPTHEVQPERVETDAVEPQVLIHEREAYRGNVGTSKVWVSGRAGMIVMDSRSVPEDPASAPKSASPGR